MAWRWTSTLTLICSKLPCTVEDNLDSGLVLEHCILQRAFCGSNLLVPFGAGSKMEHQASYKAIQRPPNRITH